VDPAGAETLAWSDAGEHYDAYRNPGVFDGKNVNWMEKVSEEQYRR
jgi:hypothetical protein